jgi:hypothetical protein
VLLSSGAPRSAEKADAKQTTIGVVRPATVALSPRGRAACIVPIRTGTIPELPVHPWSASTFISDFEWSDMLRQVGRRAFAIVNSKENGGSLTPRSQIGQIDEF